MGHSLSVCDFSAFWALLPLSVIIKTCHKKRDAQEGFFAIKITVMIRLWGIIHSLMRMVTVRRKFHAPSPARKSLQFNAGRKGKEKLKHSDDGNQKRHRRRSKTTMQANPIFIFFFNAIAWDSCHSHLSLSLTRSNLLHVIKNCDGTSDVLRAEKNLRGNVLLHFCKKKLSAERGNEEKKKCISCLSCFVTFWKEENHRIPHIIWSMPIKFSSKITSVSVRFACLIWLDYHCIGSKLMSFTASLVAQDKLPSGKRRQR